MPFHTLDIPTMTCVGIMLVYAYEIYWKVSGLPVSTFSSRLSSKAHNRTVESSLAVANLPSSGLKLNPRTASR